MTFTDEEKLQIFPGARLSNDESIVYLEGYTAIFRELIHKLKETFINNAGEPYDVHTDDNFFYRLMERDPDTGEWTETENTIKMPCLILLYQNDAIPQLGNEFEEDYIPFGTFELTEDNETITGNSLIRFKNRVIKDIFFDLYILHNSKFLSIDDTELWNHFLYLNEYIYVGRKIDQETNEVIKPGIHYKLKQTTNMLPVINTDFPDFKIRKVSFKVDRVITVDPNNTIESWEIVKDFDIICEAKLED